MSSLILEGTAVAETVDKQTIPKKKPFTVIENVKGQRIPLTPPDYVDDVKINLPANAVKVLEKRYLRRDLDGSLLETPAGMFYRIAYHLVFMNHKWSHRYVSTERGGNSRLGHCARRRTVNAGVGGRTGHNPLWGVQNALLA